MFEWLEHELAEIRTKRFHIVDGPASDTPRLAVLTSSLNAPPSYVDFVRRFGNAKLYRMTNLDLYWLRVLAAPQEVESRKREPLLYIGGYDDSRAYLKPEMLGPAVEAPIYESTETGIRKSADTFDSWLTARASRARRRYTRKEWAEVLRGPVPFSEEEVAIVEARRQFSWRVVGVTPTGEILYEVTNGSSRRLPFLSIGIRSKRLHGGIFLPIGQIGPGETVVIAHETYRDWIEPEEVEAYSLPDPGPEERTRYREFRPLG